MGGVVSVVSQGFLVREACVGVLVGGAGFLLSGVQWSDPYLIFGLGRSPGEGNGNLLQ